MNQEEIDNDELRQLVADFYVIQKALTSSDLGTSGADGRPMYPIYNTKLAGDLQLIQSELAKHNVSVEEAKLPERKFVGTSFEYMDEFEKQDALKLVAVIEGNVIQPPKHLIHLVQLFINKLPEPWK